MTYLNYLKTYSTLEPTILVMSEIGLTDTYIASKLGIARQTIYNVRERQRPLIKALQTLNDTPTLK